VYVAIIVFISFQVILITIAGSNLTFYLQR
jgi:hypothetical protein